ncbi:MULTISPECIES: hypothetical protein [unclassified Microcoleus]|nr:MULTISPECIES: hypothetical protein [unclassified Microcoleus]
MLKIVNASDWVLLRKFRWEAAREKGIFGESAIARQVGRGIIS